MTNAAPLPEAVGVATRRQRLAADPLRSAWVIASAGSGKTQVLTDRILRLLLAGARPESLLCLTYTKAAAANMARRLHRDLAAWAAPGSPDLDRALRRLTGGEPDAELGSRARRLLAKVLDAPGGMRIGTIHSFAQALLRRFPLEAGVAPHFGVLDDADRADLRRDAREGVFAAADADPLLHAALDRLARRFAPGTFGELVNALVQGGAAPSDRPVVLAACGLAADATAETVMADAVTGADASALVGAATALAAGTDADRTRAAAIRAWLEGDMQHRHARWPDWAGLFLTKDGEVRADKGLATKKAVELNPATLAILKAEAARIQDVQDAMRAIETADIGDALATLAMPILRRFAETKSRRGMLDYDDLIAASERLLAGEDGPWVRYRLDGGLDHLLVDEAQDTAPAQWAIARALTEEFFAGEGAREDVRRSVFAVGDPKQSIFSFQGADVEAFRQASTDFARAAIAGGAAFETVELPVSFRSAPAVLDLVNALRDDFGWPEHTAARTGQGGVVELWPVFEPPPKPDDPFTTDPPAESDQLCAETLAATLKRWFGTLDMPSRGRALGAGDVMVLVRRRKAFVGHLMRALKKEGVAVAGLDRLRLIDSLAVQDCLAFLDALLLPEDDLNLAAVLKGPFCMVSEDRLMALALGRKGPLIAALRTRADEFPEWRWAADLLEKFRARADFADAHALLCELLLHPTPDAPTGRAALLARLGEEAVEPLDELLQAALADSLRHPPSLQGFLHRLRTANAELKRDVDHAADAVRIMTVHGAKGLQAPLVVLADTVGLPERPKHLVRLDERPAWLPPQKARPRALQAAYDRAWDLQMAEYQRLLYVALTRAEDRLVVVGWCGRTGQGQTRRPDDASWYAHVRGGFDRLAAATLTEPGLGEIRRHAPARTAAAPDRPDSPVQTAAPLALPAWAGTAPSETPAPQRLKPSGAEDEPELPPAPPPFDATDPSAARRRRGDLTHLLLQLLPTLPPRERAAQASAWLAAHAADLDPATSAAIAAEALGVLDHPDAAALFDPGGLAEAPIVGMLDGRPVNGVIDRLVVAPDRIWLADYKTDRAPPDRPEDAPAKYLRQLAIYRTLIGRLYPDRPVHAVLVWTAIPRVMKLPPSLLDRLSPVKIA